MLMTLVQYRIVILLYSFRLNYWQDQALALPALSPLTKPLTEVRA